MYRVVPALSHHHVGSTSDEVHLMATDRKASFAKRQRELEQKDRARQREQRRAERRANRENAATNTNLDPDVDPDLIGIVPGPQPPPDDVGGGADNGPGDPTD